MNCTLLQYRPRKRTSFGHQAKLSTSIEFDWAYTRAMAKVIGLGHVGVFCRDLANMESFYRDVLGLTVTKKRPGSMVFLSSDPQRSDHEIALMTGRPDGDDFNPIQQISMGVDSLDSVREFHD